MTVAFENALADLSAQQSKQTPAAPAAPLPTPQAPSLFEQELGKVEAAQNTVAQREPIGAPVVDFGRSVLSGAVDFAKLPFEAVNLATGDSFEAPQQIAKWLGDAADAITATSSPETLKQMQAVQQAVEDPNKTVVDVLREAVSNPRSIAMMAGQSVPTIAGAVIPGVGATKLATTAPAAVRYGIGLISKLRNGEALTAAESRAAAQMLRAATAAEQNAGKIGAAAGVGANMGMNMADTWRETEGNPLPKRYLGTGLAGAMTLLGDKATGNGLEGQFIRRMIGNDVANTAGRSVGGNIARGAVSGGLREGIQEGVFEQPGQSIGEMLGKGEDVDLNRVSKDSALAGLTGLLMGGAGGAGEGASRPVRAPQQDTKQAQPAESQAPEDQNSRAAQLIQNLITEARRRGNAQQTPQEAAPQGQQAAPSAADTARQEAAAARVNETLDALEVDNRRSRVAQAFNIGRGEAPAQQVQAPQAENGSALDAAQEELFSVSPRESTEANIRRGNESMERALRDKTDVHRAMYRKGLGWVDFVYGEEGEGPNAKGRRKGAKGLAHILEARVRKDGMSPEQARGVLPEIVKTIAQGEEASRYKFQGSERVDLHDNGMVAHLVKNPGNNAWLLSGYEAWPDATSAGSDAAGATSRNSTSPQVARGAEPTLGQRAASVLAANRPTALRPKRAVPSSQPGSNINQAEGNVNEDSGLRFSKAAPREDRDIDVVEDKQYERERTESAESAQSAPDDSGREAGKKEAEDHEWHGPLTQLFEGYEQNPDSVPNSNGKDQAEADERNKALPHPAKGRHVPFGNAIKDHIGGDKNRRKAVEDLFRLMTTKHQRQVVARSKSKRQIVYQKTINGEVQEAAARAGIDLTDISSPVTQELLTDIVVNDALYATDANKSAIGWYDEKVRICLSEAGTMFPELDPLGDKFDANEAFRFMYILATTSNGLKVAKNLPLAVKIYREYKRTGVIPGWGEGTQSEPMIKTLKDFPKTQATFDDIDQMRKFFMTTWTVRQLEQMGYDVGGEGANELVRGAAIIGPKIGNGFFSNLNGLFDALTMDRWFMRTWGRWTGTLIAFKPDAFKEKVSKFRDILREIKARADAGDKTYQDYRTWLKENGDFDIDAALAIKDAPDEMVAKEEDIKSDSSDFVKAVKKAANTFMPAKFREAYGKLWGTKERPNSIGWRWYSALKGVQRAAATDKVAPAGSGERKYIRSIFTSALEKIHQYDGLERLSMADLQAALWYAEKKIYENARSKDEKYKEDYDDDKAPDYANVMADEAKANGVNSFRIYNAKARAYEAIHNETQASEGSVRARYDTLEGRDKAHFFGTRSFGTLRRDRGVSVAHGAKQGQRGAAVYRNERQVAGPGVRAADGRVSGTVSDLDEGGSAQRGGRLPAVRLTPVAVWKPGRAVSNALTAYQEIQGRDTTSATPVFNEYEPTAEAAEAFANALKEAKKNIGPNGACVEEKSIEELTGQDEGHSQCRIFLSEDRRCGFVIKNGDDLVSVFSAKGSNSGDAIVEAAVAAGARRLDCFNTILPAFYARHGFRPVARLEFNRDYAPYDWDYEHFKKFNDGAPDIVFMVYDNDFNGTGWKKLLRDAPYTDGEHYGEPYVSEAVKKYEDHNKVVQEAVDEASGGTSGRKTKDTRKSEVRASVSGETDQLASYAEPPSSQSRANGRTTRAQCAEALKGDPEIGAAVSAMMRRGELIIVDSVDDLPAKDQKSFSAHAPNWRDSTQGFYSPTEHKAYLIASNIRRGEERSVFMHEVGVHAAQGRDPIKMDRELKQAVTRVENGYKAGDKIAKRVKHRLVGAGIIRSESDPIPRDSEEAVDETMAYLVSELSLDEDTRTPFRKFIDGLVSKVRDWLNRHGFSINPTYRDFLNFALGNVQEIGEHGFYGPRESRRWINSKGSLSAAHWTKNAATRKLHEVLVKAPLGLEENAEGDLEWAYGRIAYEKLGQLFGAADTVLNTGLKSAPKELRKQLRQMAASIDNAGRKAVDVVSAMQQFTPEERRLISDIVDGELKPGVIPPKTIVNVANRIMDIFDKQGQELVELGMLSPESYARYRHRYMPRYYYRNARGMDNETSFFRSFFRAKTEGFRGNHLKGRGIFESIPAEMLKDYLDLGWELRDPAADVDSVLEDPEGGPLFVTVWRDYTPEERQKMGEVRDSSYRFGVGYLESQRDLALGRLFRAISQNPDWCADTPAEGWTQVPATVIPGTGGVMRYGALAGKYVPDFVLTHLSKYEETSSAAKRAYKTALAFWKEGKTAMNPVSHVNNTMGNLIAAHFAGVDMWDGVTYTKAIRSLLTGDERFKEAREAGLFTGSFTQEEFAKAFPKELRPMLEREKSMGQRVGDVLMTVLTFGLRAPLRAAYNGEDSIFKMAIYEKCREAGLSPEDSVDYALQHIFAYDTLPAGARKMRDYALPFFAWTYQAIPMLARTALQYPWRFAMPAVAMYTVNTLGYLSSIMAAGGSLDDDDWEDELKKARELEKAERTLLPEYMQGMTAYGTPKFMRLGNDDATGLPTYMNMSNIIPGGNFFDTENQLGGVPFPEIILPSHPVISAYMAMIANKDTFSGNEIVAKRSDTTEEKLSKWGTWLWKQASPAIAVSNYHWTRVMNGIAAEVGKPVWNPFGDDWTGIDKYGNPMPLDVALKNMAGIKVRTVDAGKEFSKQARILKSEVSKARAEASSARRSAKVGASTEEAAQQVIERKKEQIGRAKERGKELTAARRKVRELTGE